MNIDSPSIAGVYDGLDGGGANTLWAVDGDEPPHTAVLTVCDTKVPVEGDLDRWVTGRLVEETSGFFKSSFVQPSASNPIDGTVWPLGVVGSGVDKGI